MVLAAAGCSGPVVTQPRLQQSVGQSFARLFGLQQSELGRGQTAPDESAVCTRNGSADQQGPGSWTCTVHFPSADGHLDALPLDVEVLATGCWTATAPTTAVGPEQLTAPTGRSFTNPLFAFDGCFDPT